VFILARRQSTFEKQSNWFCYYKICPSTPDKKYNKENNNAVAKTAEQNAQKYA